MASGQRDSEPGRASPRGRRARDRKARHGRAEIDRRRAGAGISGQRQVRPMGQADDGNSGFGHAGAPLSSSAMRAARRSATASLGRRGQSSRPDGRDQVDLILRPAHDADGRRHVIGDQPVTPLAQALFGRMGDDVVRLGGEADDQARPERPRARQCVARISGLATRRSSGAAPPGCFLILPVHGSATRQSATAATTDGRISAGSAAPTAASISAAVSTRTTATPAGSAIVTGPATRVTRAPRAASAAAMAWPWRPLLRLAI